MVGLATLLTPFCKAAAGDETVYMGSVRRLGERSLWRGRVRIGRYQGVGSNPVHHSSNHLPVTAQAGKRVWEHGVRKERRGFSAGDPKPHPNHILITQLT